jgi:hypothetical protein
MEIEVMSSCHRVMYYDRTVKVLVTSSALTRAGMYPGKGGPPASQRLRLSIRLHAAACAAACRCMRGRPLQDEIRTQQSVGGVSALARARQSSRTVQTHDEWLRSVARVCSQSLHSRSVWLRSLSPTSPYGASVRQAAAASRGRADPLIDLIKYLGGKPPRNFPKTLPPSRCRSVKNG